MAGRLCAYCRSARCDVSGACFDPDCACACGRIVDDQDDYDTENE
jgi:hypothetical protein